MILRKTFVIASWKYWDREINSAVKVFRNRFFVYPNMLLANKITFSRIDIMADKNSVVGHNDKKPSKYEYTGLEGFITSDYALDFALDNKIPDSHVSLVYDSAPNDDDGEPVPEKDTVDEHDVCIANVA